ncbi:RluA family pseudouridine synthase [Candidatus Pelagibacter communis]|uniref:RluA family pseudouridine synthase n=1 Tax=Pelagibacter ubique TaxID=198252 RepID=UPI00094C9934|nr:RNA pseudouridine synthase [Candidatus Pelagibacter ubique]
MRKSFTVDEDFNNSRLDKWFKQKIINLPHSLIEKIIRNNKIKINKKKTKSSYRLQTGDLVEIFDINRFKPTNEKKKIKYLPKKREIGSYDKYVLEDNENFIVINKPTGIPVQSGTKSLKNIIDILKNTKYFENSKPFIVHRLDKETSGVLIIAKNRKFAQLFTSLFRIRKIHKTYLAIVYGKVNKSIKIMRDNLIYFENNKKITQKAISNLRIIKSNEDYTFLELNPITGRKHQLRKQLLNIGCPIVGDDKYFLNNRKRIKIKSLMLHAYRIKFMINNVQYNFKANYDNIFEDFLKKKI